MPLSMNVAIGESLRLSGPAVITLLERSGQRARIAIQAQPDVKVERIAAPAADAATVQAGLSSRRAREGVETTP